MTLENAIALQAKLNATTHGDRTAVLVAMRDTTTLRIVSYNVQFRTVDDDKPTIDGRYRFDVMR